MTGKFIHILAATTSLTWAMPALAQATSETGGGLEEIVVTQAA